MPNPETPAAAPPSSNGANGASFIPPKIRNDRVKTPTLLQMEAVECGAAALGIVMRYHGLFLALEQLRLECGVSRDGSKASNVLRAARRFHLESKGYKHETAALYTMPKPLIIFWNFNHFLVLEGFKSGKVFLNDPAVGPRTITHDELDASFTGVVLEIKPGPEFKRGGDKPSLIPGLIRRLRGSRTALLYAVLTGLFLVVPGLVVPTFNRVFVDEFLVAGHHEWVRPLLLAMLLTAAMRMGLTWLQGHALLRFQTKLALTSSAKFFSHVLRLPVEFFAQRFAGEIGSRVQINDTVAQLLSGQLATTLLDGVVIIFYGALMFQYDAVLTLTCILLSLLNIVAVRLVSRSRVDGSRRLLQEHGKLMGTAMGGLQMIETLKATGGEDSFFGRWAGYQAKALKAKQALGLSGQIVNAVPPLLSTVTTTVVLGLGGFRVMNGFLTMGMLVAFQTLLSSFIRPINTFVGLGSQLQELEGDMNRLDDVLRYEQDPAYTRHQVDAGGKGTSNGGAVSVKESGLLNVIKLSGNVELRNVTFGYSKLEGPLIENFNLVIEPGKRVALCGGSGSGKSTVAKLVSGLYRPWSGEVLIDGVPREEIPPSLLTNSVGLVDQEIFLFEGTVRDNLGMWDTTIPETNITQAARDACIAEVIAARPDGFNSRVEEGGANFSGGQRQRLEIARALVGNPTFMILDEATSALDPATEKNIENNLRRRGCACLIVAHRLSTIRDCDEIIVMRRGKIVQRGTHDEMKQIDGPYSLLIQE